MIRRLKLGCVVMVFVLGLGAWVFAGTTGKLTGQVTDEQGLPLPGASVVIEGTKRGSVTDEEGVFLILSIEPA